MRHNYFRVDPTTSNPDVKCAWCGLHVHYARDDGQEPGWRDYAYYSAEGYKLEGEPSCPGPLVDSANAVPMASPREKP